LGIDHTPPTLYDISTVAPYGGAPFRDFEVWWNGWDALSGLDTYDIQYRVDENPTWNNLVLRTTDVYTDFVGDDGHTYYFRARARDNVGNLSLYSTEEVSHTVDICDISPDDYENDNTSGYASSLSPNGYAQIHNIHAEGDADWIKFTAQAGVTYTLTTGNSGQHADTVLELYDTDGSTLLAENDDCPDRWPSSCLEWQAPNAGTYYVKVYHWDPWAYGCTTEYGLSITSDQAPSLNLGEPGTAFRYVNTLGTTDVPYLTDEQHLNSPQGVAIDSNGNLYVTEVMGQRLLKYNSSGQLLWAFGQPGINAWDETHLAYPHGVALDETRDRVYVANSDAHVVMILDTEGNHIGTLGTLGESGSDSTHLNNPRGVTVAADGTTYVSDTGNHRVQIFDSAGNYQHTLGTGQGSGDYEFNEPDGLALGGGGRLYVADYQNHRVQVFTADRVYSATLGITGEVGTDNTHFDHPNAIAVDDANNLYVVDNGNHRVQKFDPALTYLDTLGESGVSGADSAHFEAPTSLAIGADGTLYVADGNNHRVQEFNGSGAYVGTHGTLGVPYLVDAQHLNHPSDVAVDANGNRFVIEYFGHRLLKFAPDGSFLTSVGTAGRMGTDNTHFGWPQGVAVADNGTVYVADTNNHRVQVFDNNLNYQATLGTGTCGGGEDKFCAPHKVTVDAEGRLYVADTWNHRVQVFDANYNLVGALGLTGEADRDNLRFDAPRGVAVDNEGHIYVADELNNRVQQCDLVGSSGSCTTFIGETGVAGDDFARLRAPLDVAVDNLGRVYVNDSYWNQRIQVFDSDGTYLTTVGGLWGSEHGKFRNPDGIDVRPDGTLLVADTDGNRVEEYTLGVPGWVPTNLNGFGDRNTWGVSALAEFEGQLYAGASNRDTHAQLWRLTDGATWTEVTPSSLNSNAVVDLAIFDGHLYASTGWGGASQLWRSSDGSTWAAVVTDGFGDPNTESIANLTAFGGYLYAATHNNMDGFAIWRSSTGDPGSWLSVLINGHGNANLNIVTGLTEFEGHLYAAAENQVGGVEIWRTADGTNWQRVAFDGFGNPNNTETGGFAVFEGYLYLGTRNDITGGQLWRSVDGTTWEPVVADGFGNLENRKLESLSVAYDALYAVTYNVKSGAEVWRSEDGESWVISTKQGWGDPNNYASLWNNATAFFNEHLYIGTWNDAHGGELWRSDLQLAQADFVASLTSGAPPFTVQFANRSSGDYNTCKWNFGDGSTAIGCASQSHTYSDEGTFSVSLQISGSGGVDTEIKVDYIQVQDLYYVYLPLTLRSR
jgi:sugar lactone lactonase YvrE